MNVQLPINKIILAGFAFAMTHWRKIIEISIVPIILSLPLFSILSTLLEQFRAMAERLNQIMPSIISGDEAETSRFVHEFFQSLPEFTALYLLLFSYAQIMLSINIYRVVIQGESHVNGLVPILDIGKIFKFFILAFFVGVITNVFTGSVLQIIIYFLIVPITLNFVRFAIGESFQLRWGLTLFTQFNLFAIQVILPLSITLIFTVIDNSIGLSGVLDMFVRALIFFYWMPITLALCYQLIALDNSKQNP